MNFAILRIQKVKDMRQIGSRAAHNARASPDAAPHADPTKRQDNQVLHGPSTATGITSAIGTKLQALPKYRRDAVLAIEVVMTASPGFFDPAKPDGKRWRAWRDRSMAWLRETFCESNVISAVLHLDEETAHIHALVVPVQAGRLRASHWLDGRPKLRALNDTYAAAVHDLGLARGQQDSRSRYIPPKAFRAMVVSVANGVAKVRREVTLPKLPKRNLLGQVSGADWRKLQSDWKRLGHEVLLLRTQVVVSGLTAASAVGRKKGVVSMRRSAGRLRPKGSSDGLKRVNRWQIANGPRSMSSSTAF
jgi:hypothetical protein